MNRSRLAALSASAMLLVATVLVPAVTSADTGGTNTIKVLNSVTNGATTTISPVGTGGSFTVNVVANGASAISGAGTGLTFDNSKLQVTAIAKDATEVANGVGYFGFPSAANLAAFLSTANSTGLIPNISWSYQDGSSAETANANHGIYSVTFSVIGVGDSSLAPSDSPAILDGTAGNYGNPLTLTSVNGSVVNHNAPVFTISAPASAAVNRGSFTDVTVTLGVSAGSPGAINLATSGLPSGVTTTFTPNPASAPSSTSTLRFSATAGATTGQVTVTITGTDASDATDQNSTTIQLTVVAPNDFSLAATPNSVTVAAGGASAPTSISVTQLTPTAGTVNLSVTSSAITGVTAVLTAGSAQVGTPDTLTITASGAAAPGNYTITVSGNNGTNTHTVNIGLTVNGAAAPNQQDVNVSGTMDSGFLGLTCPTSVAMPLLRGNTNLANVPCVVYTNTVWALSVNDVKTSQYQGFMTQGNPVTHALSDSMHVLADPFIQGGDVFYHNNVDLRAGGTVLTGTNSANAPLVLSQYVRPSTFPGTYSIQLTFSAMSTF